MPGKASRIATAIGTGLRSSKNSKAAASRISAALSITGELKNPTMSKISLTKAKIKASAKRALTAADILIKFIHMAISKYL